jgi:radical SAM family uncharacterized protein/radical SAM-linked protein
MRSLLEEKFFPFVIKPGRYTGGELGQIVKPPENRLTIALGYPDMYEIGMSYLGSQILYNIINSDDRFLCERFFAPDRDAEEILRREKIPLFSLESHRPLNQFDVVGFTLAYEMVYSNLLNILDLSGIPLRAEDRGDDCPLIIAGGPIAHNPEPISSFIDLFHIGDAEEIILDLLSAILESKNLARRERLSKIAKEIPSVYVPEFYDPSSRAPLFDFAPPKIKSARVKRLKKEHYPIRPIVPFIETVHDRLTVEIMRGCPRRCRFCQATAIYRPARLRDREEIISQIQSQLEKTGYDEVTLLSLSSSDYPEIGPLAAQLSRALSEKKVALSFPSLRPGTLTPELIAAVKLTRKTGLTFAPEAGTERLRAVVRKYITDEELYESVRLAFENGWNLVKLYFMIGLPTETEEDLKGMAQIIKEVGRIARQYRGNNAVNVTISPFSPKSHTPFQWDEQASPEIIRSKNDFVKRNGHAPAVNIKLRDPELAYLEGILGRGGRELGDVIETAFKDGARFDGWSEGFDYKLWMNAFEKNKIDPRSYLAGRSFSERLPWSHIELDVSTERLVEERKRASAGSKEKPEKSEPLLKDGSEDENGFGRSRKKIIARSSAPPNKNLVRIKWGRRGLTRFLSHLDNMRAIERAIRRSGLPAEYSQGFHPHMKLSFGPPLSVGFTSEAEYFDLSLEQVFSPEMARRLSAEFPDGYFMIMAKSLLSAKESISSRLNRAVYRATIRRIGDIKEKIEWLMSQSKVEIERAAKEETKVLDIRPAIYSVECADKGEKGGETAEIIMELGLGSAGYARPQEVLMAAGLIDKRDISALKIHRKDLLFVDEFGKRLTPMEF